MSKMKNTVLLLIFNLFLFCSLAFAEAAQESMELLNLYTSSSDSPQAISHSGFAIAVSNTDLAEVSTSVLMAEAWLRKNVLAHYPSAPIATILVDGDEIELSLTLQSLKNIHHSLTRWGLEANIKVSASLSPSRLRNSQRSDFFRPVMEFLKSRSSTYSIKLSPFGHESMADIVASHSDAMNRVGVHGLRSFNLIPSDIAAVKRKLQALSFPAKPNPSPETETPNPPIHSSVGFSVPSNIAKQPKPASPPKNDVAFEPPNASPPKNDIAFAPQMVSPPENDVIFAPQPAPPTENGVALAPQNASPPKNDIAFAPENASPPKNDFVFTPQNAPPPKNDVIFAPQMAPQTENGIALAPQNAPPPENDVTFAPENASPPENNGSSAPENGVIFAPITATPPENGVAFSPPKPRLHEPRTPPPAPYHYGPALPPCYGPSPSPSPPVSTALHGLWCVAKPSVPSEALQAAMDYACGEGSADCAAISAGGRCFSPDTVVAHASYAFNAYWQKHKRSGGTCSFAGTAMLINTDPSFLHCRFILT